MADILETSNDYPDSVSAGSDSFEEITVEDDEDYEIASSDFVSLSKTATTMATTTEEKPANPEKQFEYVEEVFDDPFAEQDVTGSLYDEQTVGTASFLELLEAQERLDNEDDEENVTKNTEETKSTMTFDLSSSDLGSQSPFTPKVNNSRRLVSSSRQITSAPVNSTQQNGEAQVALTEAIGQLLQLVSQLNLDGATVASELQSVSHSVPAFTASAMASPTTPRPSLVLPQVIDPNTKPDEQTVFSDCWDFTSDKKYHKSSGDLIGPLSPTRSSKR